MTRPEGVSEQAWGAAVMQARQDPHLLARLVRARRVHRDPHATRTLPLPLPPRNPTIRPNKKKRGKR